MGSAPATSSVRGLLINFQVIPRWLPALLLVSVPGCHVGAGPVVGYRFEDDARVGWEMSGGFAVARASIGQAFSYGEGEDTVFYAAAEPGILVGATLGVDVSSSGDTGFMPGAWAGAPVYPLGESTQESEVLDMQPMVTLAIGYRYAHGHEIYFAPKLYLIENPRFH